MSPETVTEKAGRGTETDEWKICQWCIHEVTEE
jgi:hypothetical protein